MGEPQPIPSPSANPSPQPGNGNPSPGATPSPSPGPTTPGNPLTMYPGVVLQAGRKLSLIGDDFTAIAERIKGLRGQGVMHPTAATAFDLMVSSQVLYGGDLARFTQMDAKTVEHSAHVVQWADESSVLNGPGWRPGKTSKFLDGQ